MTETSEIREERQRDFEKTGRMFTKNGHQIVKWLKHHGEAVLWKTL